MLLTHTQSIGKSNAHISIYETVMLNLQLSEIE